MKYFDLKIKIVAISYIMLEKNPFTSSQRLLTKLFKRFNVPLKNTFVREFFFMEFVFFKKQIIVCYLHCLFISRLAPGAFHAEIYENYVQCSSQ